MASILEQIRTYIPATYNALADVSYFGMAGLQRAVETTKFRLFGTVVPESLEATVYSPFALDYASKVAVLRIIPAGVDFWSDHPTSVNARDESLTYPDRTASLWKIHERFLVEIKQDASIFESLHPQVLRRTKGDTPSVSHWADELLTPDPKDWGSGHSQAGFGKSPNADLLPWSRWG